MIRIHSHIGIFHFSITRFYAVSFLSSVIAKSSAGVFPRRERTTPTAPRITSTSVAASHRRDDSFSLESVSATAAGAGTGDGGSSSATGTSAAGALGEPLLSLCAETLAFCDKETLGDGGGSDASSARRAAVNPFG